MNVLWINRPRSASFEGENGDNDGHLVVDGDKFAHLRTGVAKNRSPGDRPFGVVNGG